MAGIRSERLAFDRRLGSDVEFCALSPWEMRCVAGGEGVADYGGSRGTYLKFELEKVSIVSIEFHGIG